VISAGFPFLLQSFFTDRLFRQRRASPHTIASYRDSFRLVLRFANKRLGKASSNLTLDDLTVPFIGDFLDSLEPGRKNSARTRNIRLAAIHSFFRYVALEEPTQALLCQRILAIPAKRHQRRPSNFSIAKRSMLCWMLQIPPLGSGAVIGPCFYSQCRPDSESPSWSVCVVRISSWEPAVMCTAWEKAEKSGTHLCVQKQQKCWTPGCANATAILRIRCFSVSEAGSLVATQSSAFSENMRQPLHEPAHRSISPRRHATERTSPIAHKAARCPARTIPPQ